MRLNERRGWSSLDVRYEAVVVISHLACQLRCFLMARSSCLNRYLYVGIRTWTRKSAEFNFPPLVCCGFQARRQESNLQPTIILHQACSIVVPIIDAFISQRAIDALMKLMKLLLISAESIIETSAHHQCQCCAASLHIIIA